MDDDISIMMKNNISYYDIIERLHKKYGHKSYIKLLLNKNYEIPFDLMEKRTDNKRNDSDIFRDGLIERYKKCIITEHDKLICDAAHIIPYNECATNNINVSDINNGLLLDKNLHHLFDAYFWSINYETSRIEIIKNNLNLPINKYNNKYIHLNKKTLEKLKHHYERFLLKN